MNEFMFIFILLTKTFICKRRFFRVLWVGSEATGSSRTAERHGARMWPPILCWFWKSEEFNFLPWALV
jgi:hypothetical protein